MSEPTPVAVADGFESFGLEEHDWDRLLMAIQVGECTPFLGAGANGSVTPLAIDLAREWAQTFQYPLPDGSDLARVAQFVAVIKNDQFYPKHLIAELFRDLGIDATEPPELLRLLASCKLPIYITTNYDDLMVRALRNEGVDVRQEVCRWNSARQKRPSVFDDRNFIPDAAHPVVFHLHGVVPEPKSLVLTENDYIDFMANVSKSSDLLPPVIQGAFSEASLLFLGYSFSDWNFRVLFRMMANYIDRSFERTHISVQLDPFDNQNRAALDYLSKYFAKLNIRVYWGPCDQFVAKLRARLAQRRRRA